MVSAPIIFMNCRHQQTLGIFPGDVLYCSNFTFCLFWASAFSLWNTCSVGLRSSDRLGRSWTSCCLAREKKCFGCMFRISALLHCPQIVELFLTSWSRFYLNKKLTPHVFIGISWASFMTVCVFFLPAFQLLAEWTWLKQEMANRQDNKYATEADAQTLSSESLNMVQIENRPLKHTLRVLHMRSSTLSNPFPSSLTMPFEIAFSKQTESLCQMGGKQITEVRVRGDAACRVHGWICSGSSKIS